MTNEMNQTTGGGVLPSSNIAAQRGRVINKILNLSGGELEAVIARASELLSQELTQEPQAECRPSA